MIDNCFILELRLFRTAALKGSISAAAKIYYMSQSAASSAIQRLETALGIPLLDHGKNRFQLTPHGYQFLEQLQQFELLFEEIAALKRNPQIGPWRFALPHSLAVAILPPILRRLEERFFQGIEIRLRIGHATKIAEWVTSGEVDLGLIIDQSGPLSYFNAYFHRNVFHLWKWASKPFYARSYRPGKAREH